MSHSVRAWLDSLSASLRLSLACGAPARVFALALPTLVACAELPTGGLGGNTGGHSGGPSAGGGRGGRDPGVGGAGTGGASGQPDGGPRGQGGQSGQAGQSGPDASGPPDGGRETGSDTNAACPAPPPEALADGWLGPYLEEQLGKLTGEREYEPGKRLTDRASAPNRQVSRMLLAKALTDLGLQPTEHAYGTGANVYAILPSTTGSTQHVVVGGHFDTVPGTAGANDNASGTAAVLAAARAATQLPCRSRNLLFVLFDEEEVGLVGSKRFARKLSDEGTDVHSVHTVDQIAWDENKNRLIELERGDADLRRYYEDAVKALGLAVPIDATTTGSTDHVSFRPRFRAIGVSEEYAGGDTTPHRHRSTDTYKTIDFTYLRSTAAIVNRAVVDLVR